LPLLLLLVVVSSLYDGRIMQDASSPLDVPPELLPGVRQKAAHKRETRTSRDGALGRVCVIHDIHCTWGSSESGLKKKEKAAARTWQMP